MKGCLIDVSDMTIQKALIANGERRPQLLQASLEFNLDGHSAVCRFSSVNVGLDLL